MKVSFPVYDKVKSSALVVKQGANKRQAIHVNEDDEVVFHAWDE